MFWVTRQWYRDWKDQDPIVAEEKSYAEARQKAMDYAGGDTHVEIVCPLENCSSVEVVAVCRGGRWVEPLRGKRPSYTGAKQDEIEGRTDEVRDLLT